MQHLRTTLLSLLLIFTPTLMTTQAADLSPASTMCSQTQANSYLQLAQPDFPTGTPVTFCFRNSSPSFFQLPSSDPWEIQDTQGNTIFKPGSGEDNPALETGQIKVWSWDQRDSQHSLVPAGSYKISFPTYRAVLPFSISPSLASPGDLLGTSTNPSPSTQSSSSSSNSSGLAGHAVSRTCTHSWFFGTQCTDHSFNGTLVISPAVSLPSQDMESQPTDSTPVTTGTDGSFQLALPPGDYLIQALLPDGTLSETSSRVSVSGNGVTQMIINLGNSLSSSRASRSAAPVKSDSGNPADCAQAADFLSHVWQPSRLQVLNNCITVTGTIASVSHSFDGDLVVGLKVDPGFEYLLSRGNKLYTTGHLRIEFPCFSKPLITERIRAACANYQNPLPEPRKGMHIQVTGQYVTDRGHGPFIWNEIHPVFAYRQI